MLHKQIPLVLYTEQMYCGKQEIYHECQRTESRQHLENTVRPEMIISRREGRDERNIVDTSEGHSGRLQHSRGRLSAVDHVMKLRNSEGIFDKDKDI